MEKDLKKSSLFHFPSFLKGASRVMDLYGKLDHTHRQENADYFALKNDWANVGNALYISIHDYAQKKKRKK
ncbi:MAG: hypothetical protein ACD_28C00200G0005 [uncultured bacterium]|nr:MAG: hypothetical protein ACD_28C00200G0005 [uncultured bacterium]KKT76833.1 MAG: hypothetical protein UW70_C0011G0004 [Candidatus Peregrinibacteria bacterium GW2011_GWA2_44_7]